MNIVYIGGSQAGCVGLLTLCSLGRKPAWIVAYDNAMKEIAFRLAIPEVYGSVSAIKTKPPQAIYLWSVHGREIVEPWLLQWATYRAFNVHPCLYAYRGADPVGRLLADGNTKASVGVHRMTDKIDEGEILIEEFVDVTGCKTKDEVYNKLYPYYAIALIKAMRMIA